MAHSVSTQGQAITALNALREAVYNKAGSNTSQVSAVKKFFAQILGSASPAVSYATAAKVLYAIQAAALGDSDVPAFTQQQANIIGSALLGVTVHSTVAQAQLAFQRIYDASIDVAAEPAHQMRAVNQLILALMAL